MAIKPSRSSLACPPRFLPTCLVALLVCAAQGSCAGQRDAEAGPEQEEPESSTSDESPSGAGDDAAVQGAKRDAAVAGATDASSTSNEQPSPARRDAEMPTAARDGSIAAMRDAGADATTSSAVTDDAGATSILPAIADPAMPGPFGAEQVPTAPGLSSHTLFVPRKLGDQGIKHPIIVWTNGATGSTSFYQRLLEHFASHGFFVVADKMSGGNHDPEIVSQKAGIDWALAEAKRVDSPYFGKIDPERLGIAGHSLGSIASFANTGHPAVKASVHWSGHLTGNPVGADESWLELLHAPAAFFCGGAEPRALPRCSGDFDNAPKAVPLFYGTLEGVGHTDVFGDANGGQWGRASVAFWRLTLASDESFRNWFRGPDCVLCKAPWTGKSRGL